MSLAPGPGFFLLPPHHSMKSKGCTRPESGQAPYQSLPHLLPAAGKGQQDSVPLEKGGWNCVRRPSADGSQLAGEEKQLTEPSSAPGNEWPSGRLQRSDRDPSGMRRMYCSLWNTLPVSVHVPISIAEIYLSHLSFLDSSCMHAEEKTQKVYRTSVSFFMICPQYLS